MHLILNIYNLVMPETDPRVDKTVKSLYLKPRDISMFWKVFTGLDKAKTGYVKLDDFYNAVEARRTMFTDEIMDFFGVDFSRGEIHFNDFLILVASFCCFEVSEILRMCLYVFDSEKIGYITVGDLKTLMNMMHNVVEPDIVKGNVKASWMALQLPADERIDYQEIHRIFLVAPKIFEPVFEFQHRMMIAILGLDWWKKKKLKLVDIKEAEIRKLHEKEARRVARRLKKKSKIIQRKMGLLKYYCCPWFRYLYDPDFMTDEERAEKARLAAIAKRQAELDAKNPVTHEWKKYEKKLEKVGDAEKFIEEKMVESLRGREERMDKRADKKAERQKLNSLL